MAHLLTPLEAGPLRLHNRLVMPPMATAKSAADGSISQAVLDYYDEKSKGGCFSLIIIEHSFVSPEGQASHNQLSAASDFALDGLRKLADIIHRNGSKAIMQINHAGSAATQDVIGTTAVGPSPIPHPRNGNMPREITKQEITGIIESFQAAAQRTKAAGFDGVEIHSAHGYLLNQFLSPLTNQRTDEYGGSIENRIRLHLEVINGVRAAVGNDFPVLLRLGAFDYKAGGTTIEDSQYAAQAFEKAGITIIDITGGLSGYISPESSEQGYFAPLSEAVKKVVSIPVILTGGITEGAAAEQLLAAKKADLIGVGRAVLKDSLWAKREVEKLRSGN